MGLMTKLFGTRSQREIKKIQPMVDAILALEPQYKQMSEEELYPLIKEKFGELIASGNKGAYMKAVMAELKGKADGKLINKVISDIASGK